MKRALANGMLPANKAFGRCAGILFLLGFLLLSISTDAQPAWNTIKDFYVAQGETGLQGSRDAISLAFRRELITDG